MKTLVEGALVVPGARLYYQMRGAGPILLMMAGGHGDADSFGAVADLLAEHHMVVTYDRRGYARSPLEDPAAGLTIGTHGDDAVALLGAVATLGVEVPLGAVAGPADVFGNSTGAMVGLDLAARRPDLVRTLVAHEPPAVGLLPAAERPEPPAELLDRLRREGPAAAMETFRAMLGIELGDDAPGGETRGGETRGDGRRSERATVNAAYFFSHEAPALDAYVPDVGALRASTSRVVPAGGETGRSHFPYRCAAVLAEALGVDLVEFPGGHNGFVTHPEAFADRVHTTVDSGAVGSGGDRPSAAR